MFVKVKKWENGIVKGKDYTYTTDLNLAEDDLVVAEFGKSDCVLCVTGLDAPEPTEFKCKSIDRLADDDDFIPYDNGMQIKVIKETVPEIQINFEDLKKNLMESLQKYKGIIVTPDNLKDCKAMRKELTRLKKDVDSYRLAKKKELSAPIKAFEDQCKTLMALIEDVEIPIKEGTDAYDEKVRDSNLTFAADAINDAVLKHNLNRFYATELTVKDEYSNLSMSESKIADDIEQRAQVLAIEQRSYESRLNAVNTFLENENESLTHKLDIKDYECACYQKMDSSVVIDIVKEDAAKIRGIEDEAKRLQKEEIERKAGIAAAVEEYVENTPEGPLDGQMGLNDFVPSGPETRQAPWESVVPTGESVDPTPTEFKFIAFANIRISGDLTKVDSAIKILESIADLDITVNSRGQF